MVANADSSVFTAIAPEGGVFVNVGHEINLDENGWSIRVELPTLCFDVVDMCVITNGNRCDHLANVSAVFHDCIA